MKHFNFCFSIFLFFFFGAVTFPLNAQTVTGSLVGHVEDSTGAVIAGARVVITETARGTVREITTNEEGNFALNSIDPGIYRVEIEQANYKKFLQENVQVAINSTVRVDANLEPGAVTETVQVEATQVQLKTDRADVSTQITSEQVEELPLNTDRNYQSILEVSPGVTEAAAIGSNFGNPNGSVVSRVNGQNERYNNFQLDGTINNQLNVISQSAIVPPPEAVQVVDVSTNAYDAEQGRAAGGVVNVQIKSGTNRLRGSAWIYNTNSEFKAKNAISTIQKPYTNLNQIGFVIGGPIIKDRTFFFGDFQAGRDRRGQNALLSVPTAAVRGGDFSSVIAVGTNCLPSGNTPSGCIFDPGVNGQTPLAQRVQFMGNIIPSNRINPAARAILARLPLPNRPGNINNYEVAGTFTQNRNSFDIKVDHKFSEATTAFGRYSFFQAATSDLPVFGDLGGATFGGGATAGEGPSRNQSVSANVTHIFSPNLITEFRFGFVRVHISSNTVSEDNLGNTLGIPNTNQNDFFSSAGIPRIAITNYDFLGTISTIPFDITENSFNIVNNWTKIVGNHSIRFGVDVRSLRLDKYQVNGNGARGEFGFTGGLTTRAGAGGGFNALAAFLLGLPQTASRTKVAQLGGYRTPQYFFFVQDRWQVNPKLTLSYGLRYEIYPYPVGIEPGDQSRYDTETNTALISGYGPVNDRVNVKTEYTNFAPRLGIAYRFDDKTVVRSGYGISYVPITLNSLANQNYGSQLNLALTGTTINFSPVYNGTPVTLATGIPNPPVLDLTSGVVTPPSSVVVGVVNPNAKRGYVQSYNLTVERDLGGFITSIGYVGSRGTRLPGTINLNTAGPGQTTANLPFNIRYGRTASVFYSDFMLSNNYNSLQARVDRRFKQLGGRLTVAYTYSKSLDYTSAFTVSNPQNIDTNLAPSDFDRTHNLVVSHVIRPFGNGGKLFDENGLRLKGLIGGFTLSGIFVARTGTPIDITGTNAAGTVTVNGTNYNRPNVNGPVRILGGLGPGELYFDTSVFSNPAPGTFGNVGRNTLRGPHYINYNATLARTFRFSERYGLQAQMTAFNVTNSPHFSNPTGTFTSGSFGISTATFGERQIRFGLKFLF